MTRADLIRELAVRISRIERPHPVRVAIDGVDASGKTMLADELVGPLEQMGRPVIRASIDSFHNPAEVRYRRGERSGEGYFRDSFNRTAVIEALLEPLGPTGNRRYRSAVFDFRVDAPVTAPVQEAPINAVLLFDGVFLLVPELRSYWDYSIFVRAGFDVTVARAEIRDIALFGIYLSEVDPEHHARVIIDNDDLANPVVVG